MAIAFAGLALLTGLTLGFKRINKPAQDGVEKTEEENAGGVQNQKAAIL